MGERAPVAPGGYEGMPSLEQGVGPSPERAPETRPELGSAQVEAAQVAMPALPTPVLTTQDDSQGDDGATPLAAGDDDLIEKEWVDRAKKIIAETKDDPYRREKEISKLQVEYIRRRYGREIGSSGA